MRIVLKPSGFVVLCCAFLGLVFFAVSAQVSLRHKTAATAANTEQAPESNGVTSNVTPMETSRSSTQPLHTEEKELLADKDMVAASWLSQISAPASCEEIIFKSDLPAFAQFRRTTILKASKPWEVQYRQNLSSSIPYSSHLRLRAWARSKSNRQILIVCEHNTDPYEKLLTRDFALTPNWQQIEIEWTSDKEIPAGWASVSIQIGGDPGEIDLAGASLTISTATP
jgi:hypothetical protein